MTSRALLEKLFSNWIVKILSVAAAIILFIFQRIGSFEERFFSVPLRYYVDEAHVVTDISVGSVRINVRGVEEDIFLLLEDDIEAYVDITEHRNEGIFKSPVLLRKSGSAETVDVEMKVEPLEATVTIEKKIVKILEVTPQLRGYPTVGYELVRHLTIPDTVEVSGPRSRIDSLEQLNTDVVDLSGLAADFTIAVPIQVQDEMVRLVGNPNVEVLGFIREIVIRRTFEAVEIAYTNLLPRLSLEVQEQLGALRLSGPQLILESLRSDDFILEADCKLLTEPGTYEIPIIPKVPGEVTVVSFQPAVVGVFAAARETTLPGVEESETETAGKDLEPSTTEGAR